MKAFNAIATALMFLLSIVGAAIAEQTYQVPVATFDNANARLVVDSISIRDAVGNEAGKVANKDRFTFVLPVGEYKVMASKAGYTSADADVKVESGGPLKLPTINLKLTPTTPSPPTTQPPTTQPPTTTPTQPISTGLTIKSFDFEDETKPNSDVEFTFEVKNLWVGTDGKGLDAEEVTVHLALKGIDDGSDLTEDLEFGTIGYKDSEEMSVVMHVPVDAEDKEYDVVATVSWESEDGAAFQSQAPVTKTLTVERADHDVAITNVEFDSDSLTVGDNAQVAVSLANTGKDDENVRVRVQSDVLGLSVTSPEFKLRESKETTQYVTFTLDKDVKTGKYPVTVTVSFGSESVSQTAVLTVNAKAAAQAQQSVTVVPVATTVQETGGQGAESPRPDVNTMAGLAVLILVIAIVAVYFAMSNKPAVVVEKKRGGR